MTIAQADGILDSFGDRHVGQRFSARQRSLVTEDAKRIHVLKRLANCQRRARACGAAEASGALETLRTLGIRIRPRIKSRSSAAT